MLKTLDLATAIAASSLGAAHADTVKLGPQPWLGYGPLWVAEEKGFFKIESKSKNISINS